MIFHQSLYVQSFCQESIIFHAEDMLLCYDMILGGVPAQLRASLRSLLFLPHYASCKYTSLPQLLHRDCPARQGGDAGHGCAHQDGGAGDAAGGTPAWECQCMNCTFLRSDRPCLSCMLCIA